MYKIHIFTPSGALTPICYGINVHRDKALPGGVFSDTGAEERHAHRAQGRLVVQAAHHAT